MRKAAVIIFLLAAEVISSAQQRQQDRNNPSMLNYPVISTRTEIVLPEVNGYKVIKADLHVHTYFSDGSVSPQYRVTEGWQDGLDAIAITDHIEYTPNGKYMDKDVTADLNYPVKLAVSKGRQLGITVIPGIEITRDPVEIGHFNALFTTDNNLIPDPDPLQAIRNAKKQGAIVQNNHPGWHRHDNNFTKVTEAAIGEGLIDGVEVFNSMEFYPDVIETAVEKGFYISCGSDLHPVSHDRYGRYGMYRDMTLVLARDSSLKSIREALESRRTLAYAYGDIAGSEELLKDFFRAAVSFKTIYTDSKGNRQVLITNNTSLPYTLALPGRPVDITLDGMTSVMVKVKGDVIGLTVTNMWYGKDLHPSLEIH